MECFTSSFQSDTLIVNQIIVFSRYLLCRGNGRGWLSQSCPTLTFRLGFLGWNMPVCSDMLPPTISSIKAFNIQGDPKGLKFGESSLARKTFGNLGFPGSLSIILSQRHLWAPSLGLRLRWWRHQRHDYLGRRRVSRLAENTRRPLRDLFS